jgi:hypothetical protein
MALGHNQIPEQHRDCESRNLTPGTHPGKRVPVDNPGDDAGLVGGSMAIATTNRLFFYKLARAAFLTGKYFQVAMGFFALLTTSYLVVIIPQHPPVILGLVVGRSGKERRCKAASGEKSNKHCVKLSRLKSHRGPPCYPRTRRAFSFLPCTRDELRLPEALSTGLSRLANLTGSVKWARGMKWPFRGAASRSLG